MHKRLKGWDTMNGMLCKVLSWGYRLALINGCATVLFGREIPSLLHRKNVPPVGFSTCSPNNKKSGDSSECLWWDFFYPFFLYNKVLTFDKMLQHPFAFSIEDIWRYLLLRPLTSFQILINVTAMYRNVSCVSKGMEYISLKSEGLFRKCN